MSTHRRYRRLRVGLVCFVLMYPPAAILLKLGSSHSGQIFPLSSWSLYSRVPGRSVVYAVRVLGTAANPRAAPLDLQDDLSLPPQARGVWAHHVIQEMGRAASASDGSRLTELRALFEQSYLPAGPPIRYLLIRRELDPLAYLRSRAIHDERIVARFEARGGAS